MQLILKRVINFEMQIQKCYLKFEKTKLIFTVQWAFNFIVAKLKKKAEMTTLHVLLLIIVSPDCSKSVKTFLNCINTFVDFSDIYGLFLKNQVQALIQ